MDHRENDGQLDTLRLYAWLARDPGGVEGIVTTQMAGVGLLPLVLTDLDRARRFGHLAGAAAVMRGSSAVLVPFTRAAELGIACGRCGWVSPHPKDAEHRYCANCHTDAP